MSDPVLYIGNKNYSSWSFRPWIGMRGRPLPLRRSWCRSTWATATRPSKRSLPPARCRFLSMGLTIWESLAILDHVARKHPESGLWPEDPGRRSQAMAMSAEMMSSFHGAQIGLPDEHAPRTHGPFRSPGDQADVARIQSLWNTCLEDYGGPFLFGSFSIADAMFAPVVNRLDVYDLRQRRRRRNTWTRSRHSRLAGMGRGRSGRALDRRRGRGLTPRPEPNQALGPGVKKILCTRWSNPGNAMYKLGKFPKSTCVSFGPWVGR
jgi:glutathione S-transferase